jgi:hypothetical protein
MLHFRRAAQLIVSTSTLLFATIGLANPQSAQPTANSHTILKSNSLIPPKPGIGIFVYNSAPQSKPVKVNPSSYLSRYTANSSDYAYIPNYYVYLGGLCTIYYQCELSPQDPTTCQTPADWQVHCTTDTNSPSSTSALNNNMRAIDTLAGTYKDWFKNQQGESITKVLVGVEMSASAICQINQGYSIPGTLDQAAIDLAIYAGPDSKNVDGLMIDLEGTATVTYPTGQQPNCAALDSPVAKGDLQAVQALRRNAMAFGTNIATNSATNSNKKSTTTTKTYTALSQLSAKFLDLLSQKMAANKYLTIYSAKVLGGAAAGGSSCNKGDESCFSLWPALNREACLSTPNSDTGSSEDSNTQCQQGFWIFPIYDQTGTQYKIPKSVAGTGRCEPGSGQSTTFNSGINDYPYIMKDIANEANSMALYAKKGYLQVAIPASGSAYNAAGYVYTMEDVAKIKSILSGSYYWGSPSSNTISKNTPINPESYICPSDISFSSSCGLLSQQDVANMNFGDSINHIQSQYVCTALSGMTYVFGGSALQKTLTPDSSICAGLPSFANNYTIPCGFLDQIGPDKSMFLGPALYQITAPDYLFESCKYHYSLYNCKSNPYAKACKQLKSSCHMIPHPYTLLDRDWRQILDWANSWYGGSPNYPVMPTQAD